MARVLAHGSRQLLAPRQAAELEWSGAALSPDPTRQTAETDQTRLAMGDDPLACARGIVRGVIGVFGFYLWIYLVMRIVGIFVGR